MKKALLLLTLLLVSCTQPKEASTSVESTSTQVESTTQKTYTNVVYCDFFYYYSDNYVIKTSHYKRCDDYLSIDDFNADTRKIVSMTSLNIDTRENTSDRPKTHYHLYVCYEN